MGQENSAVGKNPVDSRLDEGIESPARMRSTTDRISCGDLRHYRAIIRWWFEHGALSKFAGFAAVTEALVLQMAMLCVEKVVVAFEPGDCPHRGIIWRRLREARASELRHRHQNNRRLARTFHLLYDFSGRLHRKAVTWAEVVLVAQKQRR